MEQSIFKLSWACFCLNRSFLTYLLLFARFFVVKEEPLVAAAAFGGGGAGALPFLERDMGFLGHFFC
jgi:hypothetical protein